MLYRIDEELKRRVDLGLLVCGKTFDISNDLTVAPGCEFGENVDLPTLIASVSSEMTSTSDSTSLSSGDAVSNPCTLEDVIAFRAQQIAHLPIEDKKAIPSLATLNGFVNDCDRLDSKQAFHDHTLSYTKKEELVNQLISSMSVELRIAVLR